MTAFRSKTPAAVWPRTTRLREDKIEANGRGFQNPSFVVGFVPQKDPMTIPMEIRFEEITKTFAGRAGGVLALDHINVGIEEGEFVCLVGPSGCGKSTLLNMLAGFEKPSSGRLLLDGTPISGPSIERAMMFQESALFPWMSARSNVEFGLKSLKLPKTQRAELADKYLKMVHLSQFADAQPHELSGGMRQRVALARSLAVDPKVLLMDEPFAALDAQTRDHLHVEIQNIWRETRKTIVFVTHNVREAVTLATRVLVFTSRPGRIKQEFNLEDLEYPRRATEPLVAETVARIQVALRDEVAKAEAKEYDQNGASLRP
jgi:NitT/TauT family transport system ATP-binding protein